MNTPLSTFEQQAKEIEKKLTEIKNGWKALKAEYQQQLKSKPTSWAGIGRGGDIAHLEQQMCELSNLINRTDG